MTRLHLECPAGHSVLLTAEAMIAVWPRPECRDMSTRGCTWGVKQAQQAFSVPNVSSHGSDLAHSCAVKIEDLILELLQFAVLRRSLVVVAGHNDLGPAATCRAQHSMGQVEGM